MLVVDADAAADEEDFNDRMRSELSSPSVPTAMEQTAEGACCCGGGAAAGPGPEAEAAKEMQ